MKKSDGDLAAMKTAAWKSLQTVKRLTKAHADVKVPRVDVVKLARDSDADARAAELVSELVDVQIACISLLHEIGKKDLRTIDRLFGMKPGSSEKLKAKYPGHWRDHTLRHCDTVIETFYRSKVSILEHLMVAAPNTIKFLKEVQEDSVYSVEQRFQAGKEIKDWTAMYFKTRQTKTGRELLDPKLKEVAEEGDALEGMLDKMLDGALVDGTEN